MRFIVVELDNGEQEFFDTSYQGFEFAKRMENSRRHSVEYVAIGEFQTLTDHVIFRGQELRYILRSMNNVKAWIMAGHRDNDESDI